MLSNSSATINNDNKNNNKNIGNNHNFLIFRKCFPLGENIITLGGKGTWPKDEVEDQSQQEARATHKMKIYSWQEIMQN